MDDLLRRNAVQRGSVGQEQIHGLLFGEQLSWQSLIYDLINSEQLDPWDIDLVLLTHKFLDRIRELEEASFFISSKVLFAASLLLRIKSEILLSEYIPGLDSILFGEKKDNKHVQERLEFDEEVPALVPRTPLPRFRRVTLQELMAALGKAISTENRRIQKIVRLRQYELETEIALPRQSVSIRDRMKSVYARVQSLFSRTERRMAFSEIAGETNEERVAAFIPLLHLDNQHKIFLEQEEHLDEIWVWMKHHYEKHHAPLLEAMRREVEEAFAAEKEERSE